MKIIFARHGQTEENKQKILQGHLPGKLSEKGKAQAKVVAEMLKSEDIDAIYASDLARAADTAREIAKFHPHASFFLSELLRERNIGIYQGKRKIDLWGDENAPLPEILPEGETEDEVYKRVIALEKFLREKYTDETILLVGHSGSGMTFIEKLIGKKPPERLKNTSISIFNILSDGTVRTLSYNKSDHVEY